MIKYIDAGNFFEFVIFILFCSITLMFRYKNSPNFREFYFVIFCAIVSLYMYFILKLSILYGHIIYFSLKFKITFEQKATIMVSSMLFRPINSNLCFFLKYKIVLRTAMLYDVSLLIYNWSRLLLLIYFLWKKAEKVWLYFKNVIKDDGESWLLFHFFFIFESDKTTKDCL